MENLPKIPNQLLLFIACLITIPFSQIKAQSIPITFTYPIEEWVDCANNGDGEFVSGEVTVLVINHFDKDGNPTRGNITPISATLIGQTTGTVFNATGVTEYLFDNTPSIGAYTETYINRYQLVGRGGIVFRFFDTVHVTMVNGNIKADIEHHSEGCF